MVKFPIVLEKYKNLIILRDDMLKGGTKSIFIPDILERGVDEYVYASPVEGGFQLALSECLGEKATIFVAKRATPFINQVIDRHYGAKVVQVPYGYLSNVTSKAKKYCEGRPNRKLIEWGGASYIDLITQRAKQVLKKTGHLNEIWCAIGSGTLVQGIMGAVPPSTQVYGIQVGAAYKGAKYPNLHVIVYPKPFKYESKLDLPFQSNRNYDRKVLEIALERATGKALMWNVF